MTPTQMKKLEKRAIALKGTAMTLDDAAFITPSGELISHSWGEMHEMIAADLGTTLPALLDIGWMRVFQFKRDLNLEMSRPLTAAQRRRITDEAEAFDMLYVDNARVDYHHSAELNNRLALARALSAANAAAAQPDRLYATMEYPAADSGATRMRVALRHHPIARVAREHRR